MRAERANKQRSRKLLWETLAGCGARQAGDSRHPPAGPKARGFGGARPRPAFRPCRRASALSAAFAGIAESFPGGAPAKRQTIGKTTKAAPEPLWQTARSILRPNNGHVAERYVAELDASVLLLLLSKLAEAQKPPPPPQENRAPIDLLCRAEEGGGLALFVVAGGVGWAEGSNGTLIIVILAREGQHGRGSEAASAAPVGESRRLLGGLAVGGGPHFRQRNRSRLRRGHFAAGQNCKKKLGVLLFLQFCLKLCKNASVLP